MMFLKLAASLLPKWLANSPSIQESIDEAASNHLGKASKIEIANDAVYTHDLRELAQTERDNVAALTAATVPGVARAQKAKGSKEMSGDFIICDDYRKGTGTIPTIVMGLVTMTALAAVTALASGIWSVSQNTPEPPPAVDKSVDTIGQIVLE